MEKYNVFNSFLLGGQYDPPKFKILLSFMGWVMFFAHGCVAFACVFTSTTNNYVGPILGGAIDVPETFLGYKNGDKFLVVVAWFGMAAGHIYFMKKLFGNYNLPWECMKEGGKAADLV